MTKVTPFHIRRFAPADTPQIMRLSLRAWGPVFAQMRPAVADYVYDAFYPKGWEARQTSDIRHFLDSDGDKIWVAAEGSEILGWVGIRLHPEDKMGELYILATDPDHQRRGIGAALMQHAFAQMKAAGMEIVMVETGDDPGHATSRATYESIGFERWPVARYFKKL